ncbi:MAG TPA: GrpB family protein [Solirubrobacteraceae bacterium]|nr:GrpB family protein [Solirubrobacteraceae bacterium]
MRPDPDARGPGADEPIRVVPYDPRWPARFDAERALLGARIDRWVLGGIHHVGSTAVEGLAAKPVIDILAGVRDLDSSRATFEPLAELGYCYAPYLADEMHWFCKPSPSRRTHHLHLIPLASARYREELAFRDHLRSHPADAAAYAELKLRLAAAHRSDRQAYTDAKGPFIAEVLARAQRASSGAWRA